MLDLNTQTDINRYNIALLELSSSQGVINKVNEDMARLKELLQYILLSENHSEQYFEFGKKFRCLSHKEQVNIMAQIVSELGFEKIVQNFILLLVKTKKIHILKEIALNWSNTFLQFKGFIKVKITSAVLLSTKQEEKIKDMVKESIGENFFLEKSVNNKILGGLILQIQDKTIDDSLKTKIAKIKASYN